MFYIVKEVKGAKYYWNKRKFHWEGLVDNGHGFATQEQAESYKKVYQRTKFQDATIQMHVFGSGVSKKIVFIKCASGRFLAYYEQDRSIISNGDTEKEAEDNLKEMYDSIMQDEKTVLKPQEITNQ